jgi:hypothetical protein
MNRMTVYEDADLAAIRIVREAVTDDTTTDPGYSYPAAVHRHVLAISERWGAGGVSAVAAALGRMVQVALLSPEKTPESLPDVLDEFEQDTIEHHGYERENPQG